MTFVLLRRDAAEVRSLTRCGLCNVSGTPRDHLLAGQPGMTRSELGLCRACGDALLALTRTLGCELSIQVDLAPRRALATTGALR
jgi:hypothetical protein